VANENPFAMNCVISPSKTLGIFAFTLLTGFATSAFAEPADQDLDDEIVLGWSTYGALNIRQFDYFKNAQDTNPRRRRQVDIERLTFEPKLKLGSRFKIEAEVEFEHGGTGSTMELDGFEEFGEFETEIEQGGEVKVDKLEIVYMGDSGGDSWLNTKFGLITVPVGVITQRHHPTDYFTTTRNRSEAKIIPSTWRSVGIGAYGNITPRLQYQAVLVQGLNSEFFRKYNWIAYGPARKFETTYADNMAGAIRLDYGTKKPHYRKIGASAYYGNTANNRQKVDKLPVDAGILVWDVHAFWESDTWTFRAMYLRGLLQNSEDVSVANSTLGGAANPGAFAALGKEAEAAFAEIGYNIQSLVPSFITRRTDIFVRYDNVDPMKTVTGAIYRDPRFREESWTAGLNYKPRPEIVAKLQYTRTQTGLDSIPTQHEISAGFGFYYSTEK
jgi:hypothetical protein